ncbi:MAG: TAT-variant-translocated molybdopterin oxidoreductase [Vicingaceae bacterium]
MSNNKKYWKGVDELHDTPSFEKSKNKEFSEYLPAEDFLGEQNLLESSKTSRRDFLKYLGFGVTAASLAACETPVNKVIPYVVKTDKINPGIANYFATAYADGNDYAEIVVKTREGRPIRIDGNKKSPLTKGGVNARINSSVLSLYDGKRFKAPQIDGGEVSWSTFNKQLKADLDAAVKGGKKVRIVTNSTCSPSTLKLIEEFIGLYPDADIHHVCYDAVSYSGMLEANEASFGMKALPTYKLENAKSIVSVGADFLSSYPNALAVESGYTKGRNPENGWMSRHFQFESRLSLTGSNADVRTPVKPSEQAAVVAALYNYIAKKTGGSAVSSPKVQYTEKIKTAAEHLLANRGSSIVLSGLNDKSTQLLVNGINQMLGNYGKTLDMSKPVYVKKGIDSDFEALVSDMKSGSVGMLLMDGVNPVYNTASDLGFEAALAKVNAVATFAVRPNATTANSKYVGAAHHYLEAWNDFNPTKGHYVVAQPTISPLFDTKQFEDTLLSLAEKDVSYHDYIKLNWKETASSMPNPPVLFEDFWNNTLHEGFVSMDTPAEQAIYKAEALNGVSIPKPASSAWELSFYEKVGIGDGNQAHNPWLQELPDPISKMTWDNYVAINPSDAREQGFATEYGEQKNADTINLTVNGVSYENVPVIAQPGQAKGTLSVALGYGQAIGKKDEIIGFNFYPAQAAKKNPSNYTAEVSFEATGSDYQVATTQTHQTIMGRTSIIRETDWKTFKNGSKEDYNPDHILATHDGPKDVKDIDLWAKHPVRKVGHHWGMSIDLNACTGCAACVTACNTENNVPVVGKDEVRRSREMHWLRIDRYFSANAEDVASKNYTEMETPEDNPQVVHQPMMCQHCNHAPCETVCPVAATTHSNEGLNQMTYNRCIGTRYCANNCPYKVRRFNWFSYQNLDKFSDLNPSQDDLGRMVLNPDVTVRARGVMEKCSMCVQMIQETKLKAKKEGRKVNDEEAQTACSTACSSNAIIFGDLNDVESEVRERSENSRAYRVIEEVGTDPNIYYQVKVRNTESNIA